MGGANSIGKAILLDTIRCAEREDAGGITKNKKVSIDFLIAFMWPTICLMYLQKNAGHLFNSKYF